MTSNHTPIALPLEYMPLEFDDWGYVRDAEGKIFAVAKYDTDESPKSLSNHRFNKTDPCAKKGAFIVRACNAHYELVAALQGLLFQDSDISDIEKTIRHVKAREALAKAGAE